MTIHLTLYQLRIYKKLIKGYLINPFVARGRDDHSFNPLLIKNILKVVKLTHSWPEHLDVTNITLCHAELVKGYLINPFMARAP